MERRVSVEMGRYETANFATTERMLFDSDDCVCSSGRSFSVR
jgi:hypothetical protein